MNEKEGKDKKATHFIPPYFIIIKMGTIEIICRSE